jgi:hypothetical protein
MATRMLLAMIADGQHLGCERVPQAQSRHVAQAQQVPGASAAGAPSLSVLYEGTIFSISHHMLHNCASLQAWVHRNAKAWC